MPNTKFSFIRCRILDKCFRSPKKHQIQDLIEACEKELNMNISRRTIYYDIDFMKSLDGWEAPIVVTAEGNRHYYHYSDPSFSIDQMPITEAQLKQIQSAVDILNSFDGLPQFEGLQDSISKLGLMTLNIGNKPCFSFQHNEFVEGLQYLTMLYNSIQYEIVLNITYKPYDETPRDIIFHPHFLKQYRNRWYVFGINQSNPDIIWNLALDRIQQINPQNDQIYVKMDIDWQDFFEDVIGVTNDMNSPVEEVHFQVQGRTVYYLLTKPIHGSQKAKWIDRNTLDVRLHVKINYELKRWLLSYANDITLIAPQSLVEAHKDSLKKALERY